MRIAPIPAMTTKMTPVAEAMLGICPSTSRPARSAIAGSRLIRGPKAFAVSPRRERYSRLNVSTGWIAASPA